MASQRQSQTTSQPADQKHHVEGTLPERSVAGLVLIAIGVIIVVSRLVPGTGEYVVLAVGIICLIAFLLTREYGWAVAAGIIGGLGVGVVLSTLFDDPSDGMVFMLSLAGGFAAVWILGFAADPPESNPWPLVPAVILAAVAISIITDTPGMVDGLITVIAVLLVLAGLRSFRRGRAEKAAAA